MSPLVTVLDRHARSWPTLDPAKPWRERDRGTVMSLYDALSTDFLYDAHFVPYHSVDGLRLNSKSFADLGEIEITCGVFDVDCPQTHGTKEPAPESWRRELREKVIALAHVHAAPFYFETRGGARILYTLEERTVIRSASAAGDWARGYHVAAAYLKRRFDIDVDTACSDWQRLYRLPYATREKGGRPERWCTWGEWDQIGSILIQATREDVQFAKSRSTVFRKPKHATANVCSLRSGDGLFFHLLRARGHVGREASRGGWIAICPNRSQHSKDTDGSDTTIVVPPSDGGETGLILCKHAHCHERFTVAEWLKLFSDSELDAARRAAGIKGAA